MRYVITIDGKLVQVDLSKAEAKRIGAELRANGQMAFMYSHAMYIKFISPIKEIK